MQALSMLPFAALLLASLLLTAVVTDLRSRRIPNSLVIAGVVMALAVHALARLAGGDSLAGPAWWSPLAGLGVGLAMLMPLHLMRGCGAGDVKLMAMVGAFVGAQTAIAATLYTLLAGGALSVLFMLSRGVAQQTLANMRSLLLDRTVRGSAVRLAPLEHTAARLPYGVAISLGTGAALLWPLGQR